MRNKYTLPVMAAAAVMVTPIAVHATTTVDFSFTGSNGGTVDGTLIFASNSGTGLLPTDIKINTAPSSITSQLAVPVDLGGGTGQYGGFTLSNGKIRAADFRYHGSYRNSSGGHSRILGLDYAGIFNYLQVGNGGVSVKTQNSAGSTGVTFTTVNASTPAPEPASIALLGAGIAGLATFRRRRRPRA